MSCQSAELSNFQFVIASTNPVLFAPLTASLPSQNMKSLALGLRTGVQSSAGRCEKRPEQ